MVFYENIYQYQVGNRSKALKDNTGEEGNPKSFFSDIFQFQHNNETHYLGYYHAKFSTMDIAQGVKCFKLKDEEMDVNARFIRTQTGMHNTLGFSFDFFSVVDRPERPVKLISFIPSTKTLSIPVVTENNQVTRRSIRYRFRNGQFERL